MSAAERLMRRGRHELARFRRLLRRLTAPVRRTEHPRPEDVTVSVIVPVKNAGPDLAALLGRVGEQKGFRGVEAVIVDSGSTDGSAETAEAFGATVVRIAPGDFSHSYARNLGAERARGDYLLFTVQDALPPSDTWLSEMYAALRRHRVAAATCGEQPRPDADLFYRVISWYHHQFMAKDGHDTVMERPLDDEPLGRRRNAQLSDTACLIGRELFLKYRHRGNYAEDLDLGLRLTGDGYRLAFLGATRIIHSHNRPAYYHLRRSYVEHLALYDMLPGYPMAPAGDAAGDIARSFGGLDELVGGRLHTLATPCPTEVLRTTVREDLRAAWPRASAPETSAGYVDERTRFFVERLAGRADPPDGAAPLPEPFLIHAMRPVAGMICDYLDQSSRTAVDAALLEEFKAALYKGWALQCGVRLASAYWTGPDDVRETLRDVHRELTTDV